MDIIFNLDGEDKFKAVVEESINYLYNNETNNALISHYMITTAKEEIKKLIIKNDFNIQNIHELLLSQEYNEERINFFLSLLQNRWDELLYSTLIHLNSTFGETVTKFDWVLKLVYGTSELKKLKYPILQLALKTVNQGEIKQKDYDINKDMLVKMINLLENIN